MVLKKMSSPSIWCGPTPQLPFVSTPCFSLHHMLNRRKACLAYYEYCEKALMRYPYLKLEFDDYNLAIHSYQFDEPFTILFRAHWRANSKTRFFIQVYHFKRSLARVIALAIYTNIHSAAALYFLVCSSYLTINCGDDKFYVRESDGKLKRHKGLYTTGVPCDEIDEQLALLKMG